MPTLLHSEFVGKLSGETKAGEWPEPRMGLSVANGSTPTELHQGGYVPLSRRKRTNMIIMTVTLDDNILHPPSIIERFAVVIRNWNSFDELSQALQTYV